MHEYRALRVHAQEDKSYTTAIETLATDDLPAGELLVELLKGQVQGRVLVTHTSLKI